MQRPIRTLIALIAVLALSGCAELTPMQKRVAAVGALVIVGAVIAHQEGRSGAGGRVPAPTNPCLQNPAACQ